LNLHPAPLPINRGSHHSFWAIMNNEPMGATIHWMIEELDAGPIVDKVAYEIPASFVASDVQKFSELLALELLRNNIAKILDGRSVSKPQVGRTTNHKKKEILEASTIFSDLQYTGDQILRLSRAVCNKGNGFLVHSENQVFRVIVSKVQNLTNP
jgi:methionyl-tRNA formyltransferase